MGDVWLLAGQSNMEGVGWIAEEDESFQGEQDVRALYMTNQWDTARHPLHDLGHALIKVHAFLGAVPRPMHNSVGPGLAFAQTMKKLTGVPQGVLCCAHGATSMAHWDPKDKAKGSDVSLYAAMVQRVEENGGRVRGLFWYQGCSDAEAAVHEDYTCNMQQFVTACREEFGENLPVVQVQIGRTVTRTNEAYCRWWGSIQEQQRLMHRHIPRLHTISAITKGLDDAIHIDNAGQQELGKEAAEAMYHLLYGSDAHGCLPPPDMCAYTVGEDLKSGNAVITIRYANLHGHLTAPGRPVGFAVCNNRQGLLPQLVFKITLCNDTVTLHLALPVSEVVGLELYYGYGQDPVCNITDGAGRGLPVMGPLMLEL